jgi:hypothetical protein
MWSKDFSQTRSRVVFLVGQFIVLIVCLAYLQYIYQSDILPDKEAKTNYRQTECFLISKKLSGEGHLLRRYRADFLISYHVNGVQYSRWVSGNGLDTSFNSNETEQEDILTQFEVGVTYPCWVNTTNPQLAILVARHNWFSIFPLIIPSIIAVAVLYFMCKNFYILLNRIPKKRAQLRKRRLLRDNDDLT